MTRRTCGLAVALVLLAGCGDGGSSGGGSSGSNSQVEVGENSPPAEKLASLEATSPTVERVAVARFRFLLGELRERCDDTPIQLSDYAVFVQQRLEEQKGVERSLRQILQSAATTVTARGDTGASCRAVFGAYLNRVGEP